MSKDTFRWRGRKQRTACKLIEGHCADDYAIVQEERILCIPELDLALIQELEIRPKAPEDEEEEVMLNLRSFWTADTT